MKLTKHATTFVHSVFHQPNSCHFMAGVLFLLIFYHVIKYLDILLTKRFHFSKRLLHRFFFSQNFAAPNLSMASSDVHSFEARARAFLSYAKTLLYNNAIVSTP